MEKEYNIKEAQQGFIVQEAKRKAPATLAGLGWGGIIGALIAGPLGAFLGGMLGGLLGLAHDTERKEGYDYN